MRRDRPHEPCMQAGRGAALRLLRATGPSSPICRRHGWPRRLPRRLPLALGGDMLHHTVARAPPGPREREGRIMADGTLDPNAKPTEEISVREVFGIDTDMIVRGFAERTARVPDFDPTYQFDRDTTLAILAGFVHNRRVMIQGYHGTGKSTHIEQVAARLNWACVRVNLDSHISRIDLIGKDAIRLRGRRAGHRVPGRHPALGAAQPDRHLLRRIRRRPPGRDVRDPARAGTRRQADAARPEQGHHAAQVLPAVRHGEHRGPRRHDRPLHRHPADQPGARWTAGPWSSRSTTSPTTPKPAIVLAKYPHYDTPKGRKTVSRMVTVADLTRAAFMNGDLSTVMSRAPCSPGPRTPDLRRRRLRLPADLPQQVRRARAPDRGRVLPALLRQGTARKRGEQRGPLTEGPSAQPSGPTAPPCRRSAPPEP